METQPDAEFQEREQKALARYRAEIEWYGQRKQSHRRTYQILQVCVIVFSSLTPILILIEPLPKALQALPAALAAILTAVLATFRFQDNYVRFGYTLELLKSESFKYETRSTREYAPGADNQQALEHFIARMEDIIMTEVADWRQAAARKAEQADQQS